MENNVLDVIVTRLHVIECHLLEGKEVKAFRDIKELEEYIEFEEVKNNEKDKLST